MKSFAINCIRMDQYLWILLSFSIVHLSADNIEVTLTAIQNGSTHTSTHGGKSGYIENSKNLRKTRAVSTTQTSPFTIPYDNFDNQCKLLATEFSYKNDLCTALNPKGYLSSQTEFFSCLHRCGQNLPYKMGYERMCACDSACAVHGDCCRDMPFFCPEAYQNRTMTVKHLEPSCVSGYRQFKSCSGMKSSTNADYSDSRRRNGSMKASDWNLYLFSKGLYTNCQDLLIFLVLLINQKVSFTLTMIYLKTVTSLSQISISFLKWFT